MASKPRRKWRRRLGWTVGVFVALVVVLAAVGAVIGPPKAEVKATYTATFPKAAVTPPAPPSKPKPKKPRLRHAQVTIASLGYSVDSSGGGPTIDYGLVLTNHSRSLEARSVVVTVHAIDAAGRSSLTDQTQVTAVPADGSFVVAGEMSSNVSLTVKNVTATVRVGHTTTQRLPVPTVGDVRVDDSQGYLTVDGWVHNPYPKPLSDDAAMYTVYFDASGRIIGSSTDEPGASIAPGATVNFNVGDNFANTPAHAASARVSVDPCGISYTALLVTCPLP